MTIIQRHTLLFLFYLSLFANSACSDKTEIDPEVPNKNNVWTTTFSKTSLMAESYAPYSAFTDKYGTITIDTSKLIRTLKDLVIPLQEKRLAHQQNGRR